MKTRLFALISFLFLISCDNESSMRNNLARFNLDTKRVKTLEHKDSLGLTRTYVEYRYDENNRVKKQLTYNYESQAHYYYATSMREYFYNDKKIRMRYYQAGEFVFEDVMLYNGKKILKLERYDDDNNLDIYSIFTYSSDTIKVQVYEVDATAYNLEYVFQEDKLIAYNKYQDGVLKCHVEMEYDKKFNPLNFRIPNFDIAGAPSELFQIFTSSGNVTQQRVFEASDKAGKEINYSYEYDDKDYPIKMKSTFFKSIQATGWIRNSYWVIRYY